MVLVILLGLLLSACGGSNGQLADESGNTGQSTLVESIDQEERKYLSLTAVLWKTETVLHFR